MQLACEGRRRGGEQQQLQQRTCAWVRLLGHIRRNSQALASTRAACRVGQGGVAGRLHLVRR